MGIPSIETGVFGGILIGAVAGDPVQSVLPGPAPALSRVLRRQYVFHVLLLGSLRIATSWPVVLRAPAFLAVDFLAVDFLRRLLRPAFLAVDFLRFFAVDFLAVAFLAVDFFAAFGQSTSSRWTSWRSTSCSRLLGGALGRRLLGVDFFASTSWLSSSLPSCGGRGGFLRCGHGCRLSLALLGGLGGLLAWPFFAGCCGRLLGRSLLCRCGLLARRPCR